MKSSHKLLPIFFLLFPALSNGQINNSTKNSENKSIMMNTTTEKNKEIIQKLYEKVLNKRNWDLLSDFVSPEFTGIQGKKGPSAFHEPIKGLIKAMPDIQWHLKELISEKNKVFVKWQVRGTHTDTFLNFEATGNQISNEGQAIFELENGKITAAQVLTDRLGFLQQLNVLPSDITRLAESKDPNQIIFIDRFMVPEEAKDEFVNRMTINRNFIKRLPGFMEDAAYESTGEDGNISFVTIAKWESEEAFKQAKEAVQAEYKKQGFDLSEMIKRLNIIIERNTYTEMIHQP